MGTVVVCLALFVAYPLAKRWDDKRDRDLARKEVIKKDIIKSCVQDYLIENNLYIEDEKVDEITDYIFKKKLYNDDESGFWVKESFLEGLKITVQSSE